jgi:hypothetical protein
MTKNEEAFARIDHMLDRWLFAQGRVPIPRPNKPPSNMPRVSVVDCPRCKSELRMIDVYGPVYEQVHGEVEGLILTCDVCFSQGQMSTYHTKRKTGDIVHPGRPS